VLSQMTRWERIGFAAVAIGAVVVVVCVGRTSIPSAVLIGLTAVMGLSFAYHDRTSTPERRGLLLVWIAFMELTFGHLAGL
jgi:hypothetical protein